MADLVTTRNLAEHDAFYARLLAVHKGLPEDQSHALNARLILILANQIGDPDVIDQALALAARDLKSDAS